jgi:DNA-binding IclR family transcriptional regulator
MQRKGAKSSDLSLAHLEQALAEIRERGYAVGREQGAREELGRALQTLADQPSNPLAVDAVDRLLEELMESLVVLNSHEEDVVDVSNVTVPVFSHSGEVLMILTAGGFAAPLSGRAIAAIGERLRASAAVIVGGAFGSVGPPNAAGEIASA